MLRRSGSFDPLYAEQVRLLYRNAPLAYSTTLVNGAILAFVQSAYISVAVSLGWYCGLALITAIRAFIVWRYARASFAVDQARFWNQIYLAGAALAGVVWGTSAFVLFPEASFAHQAFIAFVLAGMAAGGITVLAPRLEACLLFLLPALLPLAFRYLTFGTGLHTAMGLMTLIFLVGMLTAAWTLHSSIRTSLTLRFDKRELQDEVALHRLTEKVLHGEKNRLQTTLSSIGEGIVLIDANGCIEYLNPAAERLCGCLASFVLHKPVSDVFESFDRHHQRTTTALEDCLRYGQQIVKQNVLFRDGKGKYLIEELATALYDREGKIVGAVAVLRDVTEALQKTEQLAYAAYHDGLTGLPNRNLLQDRIEHAIARAQRKHEHFTLFFLDLDRFKAINDSMGHAIGDELLVSIAKRLTDCVREEDTVARLGGDEFVVLLDGPTEEKQVKALADKILDALRKPFQLGSELVTITVSIGASLYPINGERAETLLLHADSAMYRAKQQGRDRMCA
ncbi:MAG TPA: diguanylate cyclase [Burkholderiales bacterium]|nr:diguanylate cyclase [Burkholderiales bacterium]